MIAFKINGYLQCSNIKRARADLLADLEKRVSQNLELVWWLTTRHKHAEVPLKQRPRREGLMERNVNVYWTSLTQRLLNHADPA